MDSKVEHQVSPISRLSVDIWRLVAELIESSEVIKLTLCGNAVLARCLRLASTRISLVWSSCRYISFGKVFDYAAQFDRLQSLSFRPISPNLRYWNPVPWHSLPRQLRSLSLSFSHAVSRVLQEDVLLSLPPSLEHLFLEEEGLTSRKTAPVRILLRGLPPTLLSCHLKSGRVFAFIFNDLLQLPPNLELLHLSFPPVPLEDDESESRVKLRFPKLPDTITDLELSHARHCLHFNTKLFPRELRNLRINASNFAAHTSTFKASDMTSINFKGLSTQCPHLHSFTSPMTLMSFTEITRFLPPTVSIVDVAIRSTRDYVIQQQDLVRTTSYKCNGQTFDQDILSGRLLLPHLTSLDTRCYSPAPDVPLVFPSTLKLLKIGEGVFDGGIASILTDMSEFRGSITSFSQLPCLRVLVMPSYRLPDDDWVLQLPNSLEEIQSFIFDHWPALRDRMRGPSQLPNLSVIDLWSHSEADADVFIDLPPQLRKLSIEQFSGDSFSKGLTSALLQGLQASSLEELSVRVAIAPNPSLASTIAFLNHLPRRLKLLYFGSPINCNFHWPVKLPSTLTALTLLGAGVPKEKEKFTPSTELFLLPPRLTYLHLDKYSFLPVQCLPSYLSVIEADAENLSMKQVAAKYFASRSASTLPDAKLSDEYK